MLGVARTLSFLMEKQPVLLIFIKNPEPGKVKTRLAKSVGDAKALQIYQSLLRHTRQTALAVDARRHLAYSNFIDTADKWSPTHFQKSVQQGDDLGARMLHGFTEAFQTGGPVVIIGSDCPGLEPPLLNQAFALLEKRDFVIGPALDGGYYLLGMRHLHPFVFTDMVWSTDQVRQTTIDRIESRQLTYSLLPALSDVDHLEDWEAHGWPWLLEE